MICVELFESVLDQLVQLAGDVLFCFGALRPDGGAEEGFAAFAFGELAPDCPFGGALAAAQYVVLAAWLAPFFDPQAVEGAGHD